MPSTTAPFTSAPSRIFVVRHGSRLDQAGRDWSQSSPTPYDTPLTYGGWIQARNLGARIASLLVADEKPQPATSSAAPPSKKKKRTRVVIHSSPFLRCIQTSVSIASGLAQHHHQQLTEAQWSSDENGQPVFKNSLADPERFTRPVLRLDAWLGEWMTMDYYTDIAPPPLSQLMVGTAKNEYMRAPVAIPLNITKSPHLTAVDLSLPTSLTGGFIPPSPSYAASSSGPIPRGYVSQAKEYVEFDYAWDSSRLGQGAELGEEWGAMHKRFRNGWKRMLNYYHGAKPSVATSTTTAQLKKKRTVIKGGEKRSHGMKCGNPTPPLSDSDSEESEDDINTVVIIVTHSAGCNALLGAITDKPVLIDIGICSVTMGVLSPTPPASAQRPPKPDEVPHPPFTYNLKLTANTEHLRPAGGSNASTPPISPFLKPRPRNASGLGGAFVLSSSSGVSSGSMGCLKTHRSVSQGTGTRPTGLWTMPRPKDRERPKSRDWIGEDVDEEAVTDRFKEFAVKVEEEAQVEAHVPIERSGATLDGGAEAPTPGGLWAAGEWNRPCKRRWTVGRGEVWNGGGN